MTTLLDPLLDLLLPARCAGCGAAGAALCPRCTAATATPRRHGLSGSPGLPVLWAAADYTGVVRTALLAYKERGRRDLAPALGTALGRAARCAAGRAQGVWLVPAPSRRVVARARGGDHVRRLARVAAGHLGRHGLSAAVCPVLRVVGRPRDSAGLTAPERVANVSGVFAVTARRAPPAGVVLLLLDDVVTTGATLAEAARTLAQAGLPVAGAAVLAATPRLCPAPDHARPWTR